MNLTLRRKAQCWPYVCRFKPKLAFFGKVFKDYFLTFTEKGALTTVVPRQTGPTDNRTPQITVPEFSGTAPK